MVFDWLEFPQMYSWCGFITAVFWCAKFFHPHVGLQHSLSLSLKSLTLSRGVERLTVKLRESACFVLTSLPSGPRFAPPSSLRCLWYVFLQQCAYLCHMYGVQAECLEGIFFSFNHRCCVHVYVGELVADYMHQASKNDTGGAPVPARA